MEYIYKKDIEIYKARVIIVFSDDFKSTINHFKINCRGLDPDNYGALCCRNENTRAEYIIIYSIKPTYSTIAHEIVHCINYLYEDRHIMLDTENDEPQAYLTGYITEIVYKAVKKFNINLDI